MLWFCLCIVVTIVEWVGALFVVIIVVYCFVVFSWDGCLCQGSPPTTWKRFSDSQILSDTSPPFQDVAAARSNSTYAQLHPVLEDTHTTQQTTQNSHYLNASTATKATFTMATTPTADYEHAKMSLQEAIKDGHVGSHLPPTQEVGPNQYLNLSMVRDSLCRFSTE